MQKIETLYQHYLAYPKIITDSRKIESGCLFFALRGDRFDGNQFAQQALEGGAAYAIIDDPAVFQEGQMILVEDVLLTLQQLANYHRRQFSIPVVAITGSNGKTTTKELLYAVLSEHYRTHCTAGNFNNHIGLPLTLLAMPLDTEIAIIEMGANHQGEIAELCLIAAPTHGLITNIGKAHLEGFGGIKGVKKGKGELFEYLAKHKGTVFVNLDESHLKAMSEIIHHRVFYLRNDRPDPLIQNYETALIKDRPYVQVAVRNGEENELINIKSQLSGSYNFNNIMTAIALGRYFKVPVEKIRKAIEAYEPRNNRSQIVHLGSNTILLDAYNANPTSMERALKDFSKTEAKRKIAILGDMYELGNYAEDEHQKIIDLATSCELDQLVLVGKKFPRSTKHLYFDNVQDAKKWYDQQQFAHTHFLLKGSRSVGLEKLLEPST